jgi:hypothetical protein
VPTAGGPARRGALSSLPQADAKGEGPQRQVPEEINRARRQPPPLKATMHRRRRGIQSMVAAPSLAIACPRGAGRARVGGACPPTRSWRACPHSRLLIPLFRLLTSDFQFPLPSPLSTCDFSTFDSSTFLSSRPLTPLECVGLTPSFAKTASATNAQSITYKIWRPYLLRNQCLRKRGGGPPLYNNGGESENDVARAAGEDHARAEPSRPGNNLALARGFGGA